MAKVEMLLAVNTMPENMQHSEGDIIDVREYPHNWALEELAMFLIIIVDISLAWNIAKGKLTQPKYKVEGDEESEELEKRAYSIPLDNLKVNHISNLDLTKVRDMTKKYQPCKSAAQLVSQFDNKNGRYLLETKDVDCIMSGISADNEVTINFDNNLIHDKYANKYLASL